MEKHRRTPHDARDRQVRIKRGGELGNIGVQVLKEVKPLCGIRMEIPQAQQEMERIMDEYSPNGNGNEAEVIHDVAEIVGRSKLNTFGLKISSGVSLFSEEQSAEKNRSFRKLKKAIRRSAFFALRNLKKQLTTRELARPISH